MQLTLLNYQLVNALIAQNGLKKSWVIKRIGLTHTPGMALLNHGYLPNSPAKRKSVLTKLAELFGLTVAELTVTLVEQKQAA